MTTLSEPDPTPSAERFSDLPRLPRDEGGPVFARETFAYASKSVPIMAGEREIAVSATVAFEIAPK